MFFDDHKKITTTILRRRNQDGSQGVLMNTKPEVMKPEEDGDGKQAATEEIMQAFMNKSPSQFKEALSNFIDLHLDGRDQGEFSDDSMEGEEQ